MNQDKPSKSPYHHGDLRTTLIASASELLQEMGVAGLSLRKLAEKTGVSRTAPYHHFKDKNQLLCAIAEQGFIQWQQDAERIFNQKDVSLKEQYRQFFHGYIHYAATHPELYDLMFGRTIWKQSSATEDLKNVAYPSFNYQVKMTQAWQQQGLLPAGEKTLRLAQVNWATMHGIARLLIDGIYADQSHIEEMCDCAVNLFTQNSIFDTYN
ncbi:TetR/AcrR family transcriptional regulator [Paraglaciecola aquimarina]|uniref:TetR/AcrR family transcriptional regulator n=1 Tax=Paraglaciecola aquimarina TaxID=1235557 RepID=A0ABU3SXA6_9ALTE|nr:TetR/AcrR family transcriptional regulator [Paraglaciecola aquimarina]MDU0354618.1 TetR/AcrR family transcriptional regulator [Paraglaciecola aquimarina]